MSESILSLQGITKSFGGTPVLNGIDLEAAQGEFITLLGSSGCGKTTTLRIIAGLEDPDQGRVLLEGQDMTHTEPNKRDVNTVFQNYALFPHMSVEQNIGYALKIRKRPKAEIREEVKKMLELVQLEGIYQVVKDTFAPLPTGAAGHAATDGFVPHLNGLGLDALLVKDLLHLRKGDGGVPTVPGASVEQQYAHGFHLVLRFAGASRLFFYGTPERRPWQGAFCKEKSFLKSGGKIEEESLKKPNMW